MKKKLYFVFFMLISISLNATDFLRLGENIQFSSHLVGLNGRSTEGPSWQNPNFLHLIEDMSPAYIRYPAGTQANYWDWHTGTFIKGSGKRPKEIFTPKYCVQGLPEATQLIYVVNMVRPTPTTGLSLSASENIRSSDIYLYKKIEDMINALKEFENQGHLPDIVELGNEFYFDNDHADIYGRNSILYLNHCKKICREIRELYPNMRFIICSTKGGTNSRDEWNNAIYNGLNSDTELNRYISGIVQHHYINDKYGNLSPVTNATLATKAIAEGFEYTSEQKTINLSNLPSGKSLWITEFGATKENAEGTWTAGLRAVAMTMGFWNWGNKVENLMWHHITETPNVLCEEKNELGPIGVSYSTLQKATKGKTDYQPIIFNQNPTVTNNIKALHGYKISSSEEESILLLNLSNQSFTNIDLSPIVNDNNNVSIIQYYSTTPYETNVKKGSGISEDTNNNFINYTLHPFSLTYLKVEKTVSGINHPTLPFFRIQNKNLSFANKNIRQVKIYNLKGNPVYKSIKSKPYHNLQKIHSGIFLLTFISNKQKHAIKIQLR